MEILILIILIVVSIVAGYWTVQQSKVHAAWDFVAKIGVAYAVYSLLSWLVSAL